MGPRKFNTELHRLWLSVFGVRFALAVAFLRSIGAPPRAPWSGPTRRYDLGAPIRTTAGRSARWAVYPDGPRGIRSGPGQRRRAGGDALVPFVVSCYVRSKNATSSDARSPARSVLAPSRKARSPVRSFFAFLCSDFLTNRMICALGPSWSQTSKKCVAWNVRHTRPSS